MKQLHWPLTCSVSLQGLIENSPSMGLINQRIAKKTMQINQVGTLKNGNEMIGIDQSLSDCQTSF